MEGAPTILVLDDEGGLAAQVKAVMAQAEPAPEVVVADEVTSLPGLFAGDRSFRVLVAGPMMAGADGIGRLQVIGEELPEISIVLAPERHPGVPMRELVRVGAVDLLLLPVDDAVLANSLVRAMALARQPVRSTLHPAPAPEAETDPAKEGPAEEPDLRGKPGAGVVIAVVSSTGAAGRTTVAVNLAAHLAALGLRVGLVDLDLVFGEAAARLGASPATSVATALAANGGLPDVAAHAVETRPGLWVLAAPHDPSAAGVVDAEGAGRLIDAAAATWDVVVVDTTPDLASATLAAVDRSDHLLVVGRSDRPGLRDLRELLERLRRQHVPAERVRLVLNRTVPGEAPVVEGAVAVPESPDQARTETTGRPVLESAPRSAVSQALIEAFAPLLPAGAEASRPRRSVRLRPRPQQPSTG